MFLGISAPTTRDLLRRWASGLRCGRARRNTAGADIAAGQGLAAGRLELKLDELELTWLPQPHSALALLRAASCLLSRWYPT